MQVSLLSDDHVELTTKQKRHRSPLDTLHYSQSSRTEEPRMGLGFWERAATPPHELWIWESSKQPSSIWLNLAKQSALYCSLLSRQ